MLHHITDEHEWMMGKRDHEPLVEPPEIEIETSCSTLQRINLFSELSKRLSWIGTS